LIDARSVSPQKKKEGERKGEGGEKNGTPNLAAKRYIFNYEREGGGGGGGKTRGKGSPPGVQLSYFFDEKKR